MKTKDALLDLMFVGSEAFSFTAGRNLVMDYRMLEVLAAVNRCTDESFDALEIAVMKRLPLFSACVVILQSWDKKRMDFISKLAVGNVPVKMILLMEHAPDGFFRSWADKI